MKTIIINKEQEKLIKESIQLQKSISSIPEWLESEINEDKTPLSNINIPKSLNRIMLKKAYSESYETAKKNFSDDITKFDTKTIKNKLDKLVAICQKKEANIKNELEKLCQETVLSLFEINDSDNLKVYPSLVSEIPSDKQFHIQSDNGYDYDSIDDFKSTDEKIEQRMLSNLLTVGGALNIYEKLQDSLVYELFKLDENLPHLYSKIMKINNYLLFVEHTEITDKNHMQSGYVNVYVGDEERVSTIESFGTIFPFMLVETLRGMLEFTQSVSLDNSEKSNYVIDCADLLKYEPYYMMIGNYMWNKVVPDNYNLSYVNNLLKKLYSMDSNEFNSLIAELMCGTKVGKQEIAELLRKTVYDTEYSRFEDDMKNKREKMNLLVDENQ